MEETLPSAATSDYSTLQEYIESCAKQMNLRIRQLDFVGSPHQFNVADFSRLINSDYICKIFGFQSGEEILPIENIIYYLEETQSYSKLYCAETLSEPVKLCGFVICGPFDPDYAQTLDEKERYHWPKWKNKRIPPNNEIEEIKLLGCLKGVGRLLFSWALIKCEKDAIILEVLGGRSNVKAYEFYRQFGFVHEIAYDPALGPTTQVRDCKYNQIVFWMGLLKAKNEKFMLSENVLKDLLSLRYIEMNLQLQKKDRIEKSKVKSPRKTQLRFSEKKTAASSKQRQRAKDAAETPICYSTCRFVRKEIGQLVGCDGGCNQWYHLICVGLTMDEVRQMSIYICDQCFSEKFKQELEKLRELLDNGLILEEQFMSRERELKEQMENDLKVVKL